MVNTYAIQSKSTVQFNLYLSSIQTIIIVLLYLLCSCQSTFNLVSQTTTLPAPFFSWSFRGNNLVAAANIGGSYPYFHYNIATGTQTDIGASTQPISVFNPPLNDQTKKCLFISHRTHLQQISVQSSTCTNTTYTPSSPQTIIASTYGLNSSFFYYATLNNNTNNSYIYTIRNNLLETGVLNYTDMTILSLIYNQQNSHIYSLTKYFSDSSISIYIFQTTLSSFLQYRTQIFTNPNICIVKNIESYGIYLITICDYQYSLYKITNGITLTLIVRKTYTDIIRDVKILSNSFVVGFQNTKLLECQFGSGGELDRIDVLSVSLPYQIQRYGTNQLFIFGRNLTIYTGGANGLYNCITFGCQVGYLCDLTGTCIINNVTNNTTNTTNNTTNNTTTNTTTNTTANTTTNTTANTTTNITTDTIANITINEIPINNPSSSSSSYLSNYFPSYLGILLTLPSVRLTFHPIIQIMIFIQDLYLYQFHSNISYPQLMQICMRQFDYLTQLKIQPYNFTALFGQVSILNSKEFDLLYIMESKWGESEQYGVQYENLYFFEAAKEIFTWNLTILVGYIAFLIGLKKLLRLLRNCFTLFDKISSFVKKRVRSWVFIVMLFENNFRMLCYYCFNSISLLFAYNPLNKLSHILTLTILFLLLSYLLSAYPLIYQSRRKSRSRLLLLTKNKKLSSYMLESILYLGNKFYKSMIHSNIIIHHKDKILFFIVFDIGIILYCWVKRNVFKGRVMFGVVMGYHMVFVGLNVGLLVRVWGGNDGEREGKLEFAISGAIIMLICIILLQAILDLTHSLYQIYLKHWKKANQIKSEKQCIERSKKQQKLYSTPIQFKYLYKTSKQMKDYKRMMNINMIKHKNNKYDGNMNKDESMNKNKNKNKINDSKINKSKSNNLNIIKSKDKSSRNRTRSKSKSKSKSNNNNMSMSSNRDKNINMDMSKDMNMNMNMNMSLSLSLSSKVSTNMNMNVSQGKNMRKNRIKKSEQKNNNMLKITNKKSKTKIDNAVQFAINEIDGY